MKYIMWRSTISEEPVSVSDKFHVISIQTRVQNLPVPLRPEPLQLAEPEPSRLARRRTAVYERLFRFEGLEEPQGSGEVVPLHRLLVLPPFAEGSSAYSSRGGESTGKSEGKRRGGEKVRRNLEVWENVGKCHETMKQWIAVCVFSLWTVQWRYNGSTL